jgi:hypothetical protein
MLVIRTMHWTMAEFLLYSRAIGHGSADLHVYGRFV